MGLSNYDQLFEIFDNMTVIELSKFTQAYETRYGVSRYDVSGPAIQTAEKLEEIVESKSTFEIYLIAAGVQKIQVIKEVKEVTGKGLADSKTLVDNPPALIKSDLSRDDADTLARRFKDLGAEVELR